MRDVCDYTGTTKSLLKAFGAAIAIISFQHMNELRTLGMKKAFYGKLVIYTLRSSWVGNLWSCRSCPKVSKKSFQSRAGGTSPC